MTPGEGHSDFFEALGVAAGLLAAVDARTVDKRVVLLSNLSTPVRQRGLHCSSVAVAQA